MFRDNLYREAFIDSGTRVSKIITEGKAKLLYENRTDVINGKRYFINNCFSYESLLPEYNFEIAKKILRQDIARFFGIAGNVEERLIKHLVLVRLGSSNEENLWMKGNNIPEEDYVTRRTNEVCILKNLGFHSLIDAFILANQSTEDPVLVDETGFNLENKSKTKIDLQLNCGLRCTPENLPKIQIELARYGLGLREEIKNVKVLVLRASL